MELVKLNLGCGDINVPGYRNLDRKNGFEAYPLDIPDGSVDEIRASHLLEHFEEYKVQDVLNDWVSKLKNGGVLKVAVPDLKKISKNYLEGKPQNTAGYIMGGQIDKDDYHKSVFDYDKLKTMMEKAGVENICEWQSEISDCASLPISLNLMGTKKGENNSAAKDDKVKIEAVMSMPRLAFSDNMFCAISSLVVGLGINLKKGSGVFWGQVLTRMMEQHLYDGTDYIITIDYDTWFTKEHVIRLLQIMQENPQIDAIVPLQVKRENDLVMFSKVDENGKPIGIVPVDEFYKEFTPIVNGHFGLTVLRVSALRKLKKPWFIGVPDSNGGWDDGRTDEDIYFWQNFYKSGCRAYLAPGVKIGHIQLMVTFAGEAVDNFKPVNAYITDIQAGKIPAGMIPKVEMKK